jgi:glyceraldehyde-3-phosphate dehydrogenase/erythrose-4-phosphate dehydrogenase
MAIRVAINGYGRIGRNILRTLYDNYGSKFQDLQISTMTVICYTNLIINTEKFFKYIPITNYNVIKKLY